MEDKKKIEAKDVTSQLKLAIFLGRSKTSVNNAFKDLGLKIPKDPAEEDLMKLDEMISLHLDKNKSVKIKEKEEEENKVPDKVIRGLEELGIFGIEDKNEILKNLSVIYQNNNILIKEIEVGIEETGAYFINQRTNLPQENPLLGSREKLLKSNNQIIKLRNDLEKLTNSKKEEEFSFNVKKK